MSIESSRELLKLNKERRVGEISYNSYQSKMKIIEYNSSEDITIEFENGWKTKSIYSLFKKGAIKSPYDISVYGHGYIGEGNYIPTINRKPTKPYMYWRTMLQRCYDKNLHKRSPSYIGCEVCSEWLNYQNFAQWFENNYYEIDNIRMNLDKDIMVKGNKVYSPETCVIVPIFINELFTKNNTRRGNFPLGVSYDKNSNKYLTYCRIHGQSSKKFLGSYDNPNDAFYIGYKPFKENYIKELANEYKDRIPQNLYDAMINYVVEITD
jgi:hypothetical protein